MKNLQRELEVWKLALSAVNDSAEQQKHGFDADKQAMMARIGVLESAQVVSSYYNRFARIVLAKLIYTRPYIRIKQCYVL